MLLEHESMLTGDDVHSRGGQPLVREDHVDSNICIITNNWKFDYRGGPYVWVRPSHFQNPFYFLVALHHFGVVGCQKGHWGF